MNPRFEELKASGNLPSPSGVALKILRLAQNENVNIQEFSTVVQADPALTGRLLKLVNSAAYRQQTAIVSVHDAIVRLGVKSLSTLAFSLSLVDSQLTGKCEAFDYEQFWSTALLRALAIQAIAKQSRVMVPEEAFTVGLVADVGLLALAQTYPQEYSDCLKANQALLMNQLFCKQCAAKIPCLEQNAQQLLEEERQLFAIDHNQITLAMLQDWNMPEMVIQGVALAHANAPDLHELRHAEQQLAAHLKLASLLAGKIGIEVSVDQIQTLSRQVGLSDQQFVALLAELFSEWNEWKTILRIDPVETLAPKTSQTAPSPSALNQSVDRLKILVVDDDPLQRHLLTTYLTSQGHRVTTASDGEETLRIQMTDPHPVLITDYWMEPMNGIALCKALRSTQSSKRLYIIMITGDQEAETLSAAFEAGVDDFINKPIAQAELDARLLGAKRMIRMLDQQSQAQESIRQYAFELATNTRRLEMITLTDQLTHLYNRRYAVSRLDREWSAFLRNGNPFAVISLDLDKFKQINDTYGHAAGDQVLIHFAKNLQNALRASDVACRMGGEEFIVIAPNTNGAQAAALAESIRQTVEAHQPIELRLPRLITVSIGAAITDMTLDSHGWEDTLKRSDKALYQAKSAGRNCFKLFEAISKRRAERIDYHGTVKVRKITTGREAEFMAEIENYSKSGLFLRCGVESLPTLGDILEVKTAEFLDVDIQLGRVVRIETKGFAVEFLNN